MPRIQLTCGSCGWVFFIAESAATVNCPSCGQQIRAVPKQAARAPDAAPAPAADKGKMTILMAAGGTAVVLLVIVVALVFSGGGKKEPPPPDAPKSDPFAVSGPPTSGGGGGADPMKLGGKEKKDDRDVPLTPVRSPRTGADPQADPIPERPAAPRESALPTGVVADIRAKVLGLHAYYLDQCLGPSDRARAQKLLAAGRGTEEDAAWLRAMVTLPAVAAAHAEMDLIERTIAELEPKASAEMPPDRLMMKDGRTIDCKVLEETADAVRIEKTGMGNASFKKEQIEKVARGEGIGTQAAKNLESARARGPEELVAFAAWCKEQNLGIVKALACNLVVKADPGNLFARNELGLGPFRPNSPGGGAEDASGGGAGGPMVTWDGKQWPALELKAKLLRDGYVILNGQWHARKERTLGVPGLQKYEKQDKRQVNIIGDMTANYESKFTYKLNPQNQQWQEEETKTYTHKFYAPVMTVTSETTVVVNTAIKETRRRVDIPTPKAGEPMLSEVSLIVGCGSPIIEGKIKAYAEVDSGSIVCSVETDGGRTELFRAVHKEDRTHKLPDGVRGKIEVKIVFTMNASATYKSSTEKRQLSKLKYGKDNKVITKEVELVHEKLVPDYPLRLFPSHSNTIEVFRATLVVGEPSIGLNNAFAQAGAMDLLKE